MVEHAGLEPATSGLQDQCSPNDELMPHILQNISRANYLHSAETLLSWSAEPLHFPTRRELNRIRDATGYVPVLLNKKHQATYFAIYRISQLS